MGGEVGGGNGRSEKTAGRLQALPGTMRRYGAGTESMENRWDLIQTVGIDGKNKMIRNGTKEKRDDRRMRFFHTEPV